MSTDTSLRLRLLSRITCPHCWFVYPPEDSLWISSDHPTLRDDAKARGQPRRFPAERFHVSGDAIDAVGARCAALACPNCHLEVPRVAYEYRPFFVSVVGAPGCGKSFFLPAMTWRLRTVLPQHFGLEFLDADPTFNLRLHDYESSLFRNPKRDELTQLEKTATKAGQAGLYDSVWMGGQEVAWPRPFVFRFQVDDRHPAIKDRAATGRSVYFYDNAGESFQPNEKGLTHHTAHLGHSHLTLFLFDPTQESTFRDACEGRSKDPQMQPRSEATSREAGMSQTQTLITAASRMKRLRDLREDEKHSGPLVVVVTKLDAWACLLDDAKSLLATPLVTPAADSGIHELHAAGVKRVSRAVRAVLERYAGDFVAAAHSGWSDVTFLACSATGSNVESLDAALGVHGIRPRDVRPIWCEVPFLIGLARNRLPVSYDDSADRRA